MTLINFGTFAMIYMQDSRLSQTVVDALNTSKSMSAYLRHQAPERFHMNHNPRFGEIIIDVDPNYYVIKNRKSKKIKLRGGHGYDPDRSKSMHGIFYAKGPHIHGEKKIRSIHNTDVHPIVKEILGMGDASTLSLTRQVVKHVKS